MRKNQFSVPDQLSSNPSIHCAALVITRNVMKSDLGLPTFAVPAEDLRNGTITFVKSNGFAYGITCWHVVEHYRKEVAAASGALSYSMRTMVNGFYVVLDRFVRPQPQFSDPDVDVAIRQVDPEFVAAIGKVPFDLDTALPTPSTLTHGLAVGFPETMKYKRTEDHMGYRISMPQVEITAKISSTPSQRFVLHSELDSVPTQSDFSGMSGGPIYWTTAESYGIFGVIYEGGVGTEVSAGRSVYVYGELATPDTIRDWIKQLPA